MGEGTEEVEDDGETGTPKTPRRRVRRVVLWIGGIVAVPLVLLLILALIPVSNDGLDESRADPAGSYREAIERFEAVAAEEPGLGVYRPCASRLLTHGRQTDTVVVLFHGMLNCPKQFDRLAEQVFATGANVLVRRAPRHGIAVDDGRAIGDSNELAGLTPDELRAWGETSIDIARGLGREVRVLGLSMGGVATMWVAQFRGDVDRAVIVSPAFEVDLLPGPLDGGFINVFTRLPNIELPSKRIVEHEYAEISTRATSAMLRLGRVVTDAATARPAAVGEVVMVLSTADTVVPTDKLAAFGRRWRDADGPVTVRYFPGNEVPHDSIDPDQPEARTAITYPLLIDALLGPAPDGSIEDAARS